MASSALSTVGSAIRSRCGHSALMCPNRLSIQAWSVGVPGRPKCWAIAHSAMNSRVEPEVICGPLSETASSTGGDVNVGIEGKGRGDVLTGFDHLQQSLGLQGVGEHDLDLGRVLLVRHDR